MVAMDSGADNGFFYTSQVMHFSSPFTVFLIYHKQNIGELRISVMFLQLNRNNRILFPISNYCKCFPNLMFDFFREKGI